MLTFELFNASLKDFYKIAGKALDDHTGRNWRAIFTTTLVCAFQHTVS